MGTNTLQLSSFTTEGGETLTSPEITYRTWGTLNEEGSNAILICHALTGSADADEWLHGLFGTGKVFDPNQDFIVCANVFGGCYGSTGPSSINPDTGKPYQADFPALTIRDLVHQQQILLDHLNVQKLKFVFGGSMGGMQALEFGIMDDRPERLVLVAMGKAHSAWAIGVGETQRQAIMADPKWQQGYYNPDDPPANGLGTARMMAMISYRTHTSFQKRFSRKVQDDNKDMFQVESYLNYQGQKLVERFDANTYIRLTQVMDSHDVGRNRQSAESALQSVKVPALVIGIDSDILYPVSEQKELAELLPNGLYKELHSEDGHDGFLIEFERLSQYIFDFLSQSDYSNVQRTDFASRT